MSRSWIDEALAQAEHAGHEGLVAEGRRQLPLAEPDKTSPDSASREQQVLDRIDRARRRRPKVREERITMSHGSGGKATHTLIEAVFLDAFRNPLLEPLEDAARLAVGGARIALTTDSYVVSPLFFPGGDIGDLAVNGTVNDLAVSDSMSASMSSSPRASMMVTPWSPIGPDTMMASPGRARATPRLTSRSMTPTPAVLM